MALLSQATVAHPEANVRVVGDQFGQSVDEGAVVAAAVLIGVGAARQVQELAGLPLAYTVRFYHVFAHGAPLCSP